MRYLIVLISFLFIQSVHGQSISYSPTSFQGWGVTMDTKKVDIRYKFLQYTFVDIKDGQQFKLNRFIEQKNHGLFFAPQIKRNGFYASGGIGYFIKKLGNDNGSHVNFMAEIGYYIDLTLIKVGVKYSHLSNGDVAEFNYGIDNISFTMAL